MSKRGGPIRSLLQRGKQFFSRPVKRESQREKNIRSRRRARAQDKARLRKFEKRYQGAYMLRALFPALHGIKFRQPGGDRSGRGAMRFEQVERARKRRKREGRAKNRISYRKLEART